MNWSLRSALASRLDDLAEGRRASLVETSAHVTAAQLSAQDVRQIASLANQLGFPFTLEDATQSSCELLAVSDDLAPYRLVLTKPVNGPSDFLTVTAFRRALTTCAGPVVRIARLVRPFETMTCRYTHWDDDASFEATTGLKSPRDLVRESHAPSVPEDLGRFVLRDINIAPTDDLVFQVWAARAYVEGVRSLASEISANGDLLFRGPSSVLLEAGSLKTAAFDAELFSYVQAALKWIFENPKETEMRHGLFSAEIARLTGSRKSLNDVIASSARFALDSARIALQLGLSELNRDALKAVAELRKAVSDDATKIVDSTRSLVGSLATAVFAGIGLIGAKLTTTTPASVLLALAIVLALYVAGVIWSGFSFIAIQRDLRIEWRTRSYAFLTDNEFKDMVLKPIQAAEKGFRAAVLFGVLGTAALLVGTGLAVAYAHSQTGQPAAAPYSK